ncbi:hypothetical protein AcV5_001153 [Taiwanofungus camphoratus]|nr:hypothetical protein AcV5_001153 [Antrodia cinnamomea]
MPTKPPVEIDLDISPRTAKAKRTITSKSPTTPRKSPCCKTCGRPRAGHQRSGCPYVNSPILPSIPKPKHQERGLADALGALNIDPDTAPADDNEISSSLKVKRIITLPSFSTDSKEVLNQLIRPGMMTDGPIDQDTQESVDRWRSSLVTPAKSKSRASPSVVPITGGQETRPTSPVHPQDRLSAPQHVSRSLGTEQKENFVAGLKETARVYEVAVDQVLGLKETAKKFGFHVQVLMPAKSSKGKPRFGLLVLGRDRKAVDELFVRCRDERKDGHCARGLVAAGGAGAVMGALSTWTGLAYL